MVDVKKFSDTDLYGMLGVEIGASEQEIRKGYRKKALQCHPDKNPDNPRAAELFQELSKALEILIDVSARAAYDKLLNAKKAAQLRNQQLDSKRQKLKNDLEERERRAREELKHGYKVNKTPEEIFQEEFERLRKEGSKLVAEEQELMRQQLRQELSQQQKQQSSYDPSKHRIKIKWKAEKCDPENGGYSETVLQKFLSKYGDINVLVMSPKKTGSALVEFKTQEAAEMAVSYEQGRLDNPCSLEWIGDAPKNKHSRTGGSATITEKDYESLVLRQLRQAEERKRLIEQMMREDAEEEAGKS
ncbi:dnaJ homolog subfamily C member 17-like [Uranotaenia lowii]|uniref:dnaJ homolog subfamily C member 17-like n=1 Tax=Uranotaenia lowii TaxID=190385 RepID=UPI002479FFD5|nr:dnaJ homolog subfamily C member 17-like [Uranotaenia lowii]XP_055605369.1 dnaJ homolog subfamily C member 17-like [Uranotaenia lowii]